MASKWAVERKLARLAVPIAGGLIVEMLYGVVDTVVVGRVHPTALAAAGFGRMGMAPVVLSLGALLYGLQAIVGRRVGAGDERAAGRATREALRLSLWFGLPTAACLFLALPWILHGALSDPGVRAHAGDYLALRMLAVPMIIASLALRGFLYGIGRAGVDLYVSLASIALNTVLSWWWCFGGAGVPALGVSGVALGTLCAEALHCIAITAWIGYGGAFRRYGVRGRGSDPAERRILIRLSSARAVQGLSLGAFPAFVAIMERIGVVEAAAANVVFTAHSILFFIGFGIGVAGGTLTAQALGAGDPAGARRVVGATARVVVLAMGLLSLAAFLAADPIVSACTDDAAVRAAALGPFRAYCAFLTVDALGASFAKLLVAAGVAVYVMVVEIVAGLLLFIPAAWFLGVHCELGAWGAWSGFALYIIAFCTLTTGKILGRSWLEVEV
ncbi:MAG: MATE family efflux transporter [Planctomycetota bacterium]|jgi:MATE family multidrug resistance protein